MSERTKKMAERQQQQQQQKRQSWPEAGVP
jgi:hypothetical protein